MENFPPSPVMFDGTLSCSIVMNVWKPSKIWKTNKQTKKLRKAPNNFFQVLPLLWEPFYFRQKFWLFWIIIIIIIKKWWHLLHPSFFSNVYIFVLLYFDFFSSREFRRLIPFCPCLILTHATSRPPVFWATHVNRKWRSSFHFRITWRLCPI